MPSFWKDLKRKLMDRVSALNLEIMTATLRKDRRRRNELASERETIREVLANNDWRRATTLCS